MTTKELTYNDYHAAVRSIAEELFEEARERKTDHDAVEERLWETVDGHEWVIYTRHNYDVLRHSANSDYAYDNWGADSIVSSETGVNWAAMAFGALYADVSETLWPMFDGREEEVEA
jgi:hypothetical protein